MQSFTTSHDETNATDDMVNNTMLEPVEHLTNSESLAADETNLQENNIIEPAFDKNNDHVETVEAAMTSVSEENTDAPIDMHKVLSEDSAQEIDEFREMSEMEAAIEIQDQIECEAQASTVSEDTAESSPEAVDISEGLDDMPDDMMEQVVNDSADSPDEPALADLVEAVDDSVQESDECGEMPEMETVVEIQDQVECEAQASTVSEDTVESSSEAVDISEGLDDMPDDMMEQAVNDSADSPDEPALVETVDDSVQESDECGEMPEMAAAVEVQDQDECEAQADTVSEDTAESSLEAVDISEGLEDMPDDMMEQVVNDSADSSDGPALVDLVETGNDPVQEIDECGETSEMEAAVEIQDQVECEAQASTVSEDTVESSPEAVDISEGLNDVPDSVMEQTIHEMTHSPDEQVLDETVVDEAVMSNDTDGDAVLDKDVLDQVGRLTRNLHDSLRELGYDKRIESMAAEVPEAQDKLAYVASKTEQAAERTLGATEVAMPIQEKLSSEATQLSEKWKMAFEEQRAQPDTEKFKLLLIETLSYIDQVPEQASATNEQLMEIMMAQDFQDLTGQVITKVTGMVQRLENDLVQLLLANVAAINNGIPADEGLMNGPVTNPEKSTDTVNSQDQVDDLLASLGF